MYAELVRSKNLVHIRLRTVYIVPSLCEGTVVSKMHSNEAIIFFL